MTITQEFLGQRARLYQESIKDSPLARDHEIRTALGYLNPRAGDKILEFGAGSGACSAIIADLITPGGELVATDPSSEQLANIQSMQKNNIRTVHTGSEHLLRPQNLLQENYFDAIWSLGAFHHCLDKTTSFINFSKLLKNQGRLLICDPFHGSNFAKYFDTEVARFSITGHEVAFLTKEFCSSLCYLSGFTPPLFHELDVVWRFASLPELSSFLYKIHGMTKTTVQECYDKAKQLLRIEKCDDFYVVHLDITIMETYKK